MIEHKVNSLDNFIGGWYTENTQLLDRIIEESLKSEHRYPGVVGSGKVATNVKDSTDVILNSMPELYEAYAKEILAPAFSEYKIKYPMSDMYDKYAVLSSTLVQHYLPNQGFKAWHTERNSARFLDVATRHLVFLTYLNDVSDAGETEFFHQKVKVKAEKGLTLIWPVDWTHTHRGIPSPTEEKFIVTGWFNYTAF